MARRSLAALLACASVFIGAARADAQTRPLVATAAAIVGDVSGAQGVLYGASTTTGVPLDALKVIPGPQSGTYIGVFHEAEPDGLFAVRLALSDDLRSWTAGSFLSRRGSMPAIVSAGGGYLVAFEFADDGGRSQIEVEYFSSYQQLLVADPSRVVRLSRHLSASNEGTPSFRSLTLDGGIADSRIVLGFHYNTGDDVDRNGIGVLVDFSRWTERQNAPLDRALEAEGVRGSIGARASFELDDRRIQLVEGQREPGSWSAWRLYAFQPATEQATEIAMSTPRGSRLSIGVPRATVLPSRSGTKVLLLTAFVYAQGSPRDLRGELVWWLPLPT